MFTTTKESSSNGIHSGISEALKSNKRENNNPAQEVGEDVSNSISEGAHKVSSFFKSASSDACSAAKNLSNRIEDNPKQSALISLCAGFLLGALVRR
jgi:ElaB/YqjD/DUF883 family membrane-anchored ribosome-binding protein